MRALLPFFEYGFVVLVTVWTLGSILFAVPRRWGRGRLIAFNQGLWFADWTVFGTGRENSGIVRFTLEFRDRVPGQPAPWRVAMHGRPWKWRACLWQPERRLADRLHRLGRHVADARDSGAAGVEKTVERTGQLIAQHLEDACPRPPGTQREIRLARRTSRLRYPFDSGAEAPVAQIAEDIVLERTEAAR